MVLGRSLVGPAQYSKHPPPPPPPTVPPPPSPSECVCVCARARARVCAYVCARVCVYVCACDSSVGCWSRLRGHGRLESTNARKRERRGGKKAHSTQFPCLMFFFFLFLFFTVYVTNGTFKKRQGCTRFISNRLRSHVGPM